MIPVGMPSVWDLAFGFNFFITQESCPEHPMRIWITFSDFLYCHGESSSHEVCKKVDQVLEPYACWQNSSGKTKVSAS